MSFVVCVVCKMAQVVGDGVKYCGAIPILFGWFLRFPYLHVHFTCACFHSENFFGTCVVFWGFFAVFLQK